MSDRLHGTEWVMTEGARSGEILKFGCDFSLQIVGPEGKDSFVGRGDWVANGVMFVFDEQGRSLPYEIVGNPPWHLDLTGNDTVLEINNNPTEIGGNYTFRGRYALKRRNACG